MERGGEPFDAGALLEWDAGKGDGLCESRTPSPSHKNLDLHSLTHLNTLPAQALCRKTLLYLDLAIGKV